MTQGTSRDIRPPVADAVEGTLVEKAPPAFLSALGGVFGLDMVDQFALTDDGDTVVGIMGRSLAVVDATERQVEGLPEGQSVAEISFVPLDDVPVTVRTADPSSWMRDIPTSPTMEVRVSIHLEERPRTLTFQMPPGGDLTPGRRWMRRLVSAIGGPT